MVAVTSVKVSQSTTPSKRWPKLSMFQFARLDAGSNGDLVVHRDGGVVRIDESDLRMFLAFRREG
jgi:hypothetical protein